LNKIKRGIKSIFFPKIHEKSTFHLKAVKTDTHEAEVEVGASAGNFLKVRAGAGAVKNSFGSATLVE
jgi:hypothetical protein